MAGPAANPANPANPDPPANPGREPGAPPRGPGAVAHGSRPAGGHGHPYEGPPGDPRILAIALGVLLAFMAGEVVAAILAHSLALLADAGHMLTDAGALGAALVATRLAARPARGAWTFGWKRAEVLSAAANGATLLVLGLLVIFSAITRLIHPPRVQGSVVLAVALAGIVVNLALTRLLARADRSRLHVDASVRHILTDLYAFTGTALAGLVIMTTGFRQADALASLAVAGLMLAAAATLLRRSGRVLMEAAPEGVDPGQIVADCRADPRVDSVHDVHVWLVTSGFPALAAHVLVRPGADCHQVRTDLEHCLAERHGIAHTTLQVEHAPASLFTLDAPPPRAARETGAS